MSKIIFCIVAILLAFQCDAQLCFSSVAHFPAGINSTYICKADFNKDGFIDLAVSNKSSNISILYGNGTGSFNPSILINTGALPVWVSATDINNDTIPDLLTANAGSWNTTSLIGSSAGSFTTGGFVGANNPYSITSGDFNGDGKQDVAIGTQYRLVIALGDGTGNFGSATYFGTGHPYLSITAAYVNSDANLDLVCAGGAYNNAWVFYGDGLGGFNNQVSIPADSGVSDVVCADFNNDGLPDLVTANTTKNSISLITQNSNGSFSTPINIPVGKAPISIKKAKLNNDNFTDLVVANQNGSSVSVLKNNMGSFGTAQTFAVDSFPHAVETGDFNNDGYDDIAVICVRTNIDSGKVDVLLNCSATGIEEHLPEPDLFTVSPNPSQGQFTIRFNEKFEKEVYSMEVVNLLGETIFTNPANTGTMAIDMNHQSKGVYFLQMKMGDHLYCRKIVVE